MNEAEVIIVLRTFSGPNLGAEVMLPPGTYVIGADYSCDIVLSDSCMAPRHATVTVEQLSPGQLPRVHVKPLDDAVIVEEEPLPAGGESIPPATPWLLGLTCLAWNMPNAPREKIIPRLPGQPVTASASLDAVVPLEQVASEKESFAPSSNTVGTISATVLPRRKRWPARLAVLLVLIALSALVFDLRSSPHSTEELVVQFRQELRQAGMENLVVNDENGRITVSGAVLNEKERGQLGAMARNLKYPVYLRVGVREDMAQAVRMKLNTSGLFPEVSFPVGKETMRVAAYIKDTQTENAAFASLKKDLPELPNIEKRVVHAVQVKSFIERELDRARLQNISITLGSGRITLTDSSPSGNHAALQRVMKRIEENLNIPLAYTIISQDAPPEANDDTGTLQPLVPGGIAPDMAVAPLGGTPLEGVNITGITLGSMQFVSLGNGQRIFIGGMLPSGHILESISLDSLTLKKSGRTTTYPLRGKNE